MYQTSEQHTLLDLYHMQWRAFRLVAAFSGDYPTRGKCQGVLVTENCSGMHEDVLGLAIGQKHWAETLSPEAPSPRKRGGFLCAKEA